MTIPDTLPLPEQYERNSTLSSSAILASLQADESYTINLVYNIKAFLQGYSGGVSILREMAQNADDVAGEDDRWLAFHFDQDALRITNNTVFSEHDFFRIKEIASGGKTYDQHKTTGAFGIGFISVYQLTDTPILCSNGCELRFLPEERRTPTRASSIIHHTEFTLPYRRHPTDLGKALEKGPVTEAWEREIIDVNLPCELPTLLLFFRRLSRVTVFEYGNQIYEVRRVIKEAASTDTPEIVDITFTRFNQEPETYRWLRFTGEVIAEPPPRPDGRPAKDRQVQLAIPDVHMPVSGTTGRLYNYQPSDLTTGLPFHINGDFYPSTERKSIDNHDPSHRQWHEHVFAALGQCFTAAIPFLLKHFTQYPLQFYQRLPLQPIVSRQSDPTSIEQAINTHIRQPFFKAAAALPVFHTITGWHTAEETRWVSEELRPVVLDITERLIDPRLMEPAIEHAAETLIKILAVQEYTLLDLLQRIKKDVQPGSSLAKGPTYLQTHDQLSRLYAVLEGSVARGCTEQIGQTSVFLDQNTSLWPADQCVKTRNAQLQQNLAESGLHFWNGDSGKYRNTAALVPEFTLSHLWRVLRERLPLEGIPLTKAPKWINSPKKLSRLYQTILDTREQIQEADVAKLPLCLDRDNQLCTPVKVFMPAEGEPVIYDILKEDMDAPLAAAAIYKEKDLRTLYEQMDVRQFSLDKMLERLLTIAKVEVPIADAHPCLNHREKLLRLYRYLSKQRLTFEDRHIDALRNHLAIWICRDGKLRTATELTLLSETAGEVPACITFHLVLDVESKENLHPFFQALDLKPLDPAGFIQQYLFPQYPGLSTDKEKHAALKYVRSHVALLNDPMHSDLWRLARQTPLIRGDNNTYYCADDLCFPDKELQDLFPNYLSVPHYTYFGTIVSTEQLSTSEWYRLFLALGVNHYAPPNLIIVEITAFTQQHKPSHGREYVEKIFRYLEKHWENHYAHKQNGQFGVRLRDLAWLPAEGDTEQWYKPTNLYPKTEKPVVDQVAKVLGFTLSRMTFQSFSQALGFPSAQSNTSIVVDQLLALSAQNRPANSEQGNDAIYQFLDRYTIKPQDIQRLRGKPIIYIGQRYWKPAQVFLSDYDEHFGFYRGYWRRDEYRKLMREFGACTEPSPHDYCDLIREISAAQSGQVSDQDVLLLITAYDVLADTPDVARKELSGIPCVVSQTSGGVHTLHCADSVILSPLEQYLQALPDVPIAVYHPKGQATLECLGVRAIEDVLRVDFQFSPDTSRASSAYEQYATLEFDIDRLLFHYDKQYRKQNIWDELGRMTIYEQDAVQVVYHVTLGTRHYHSEELPKEIHYERDEHCAYLQKELNSQDRAWALGDVLHQVLGIKEIARSVLKDVIADPANAGRILDRNHIKTLPLPPTPPEGVTIAITQSGQVNQPYTFKAQVTPPTVTPAPTYAWCIDGKPIIGANKVVYTHTWQDSGEKVVTVTVMNDLDKVACSMPVSVSDFRPIAPTGVTLRMAPSATVGALHTMIAEIEPENAAQPLTYTWTIDGRQVTQTTNNAYKHLWEHAVHSDVAVTVSNTAGSVQDHCHVTVTQPVSIAPSDVSIKGPGKAELGQSSTFTTKVRPDTVTSPLHYRWVLNGIELESKNAELVHTWEYAGIYEIHLEVENDVGTTSAKKTVTVAAPQPAAPEHVEIRSSSDCTVGRPCIFTAKVAPRITELPLAFTWYVDDKPVDQNGHIFRCTWDSEGRKHITVTVKNQMGQATGTLTAIVKPQPPKADKLASPTGKTDRDDLRERVREDAIARGMPLEEPSNDHSPSSEAKLDRPVVKPKGSDAREARFVLSYPEVHRGFLYVNKTNKGVQLFADRPEQVECVTEYGDAFTLWFKWERDFPIAYNAEHLAAFFAGQSIQAGCIVYIERLSTTQYRLYYKQVLRRVPQITMAFSEQGELYYETHDIEINCEVDEAVYRADMRFADEIALALEAIGKKTVKEMICDIFLQAEAEWLPEVDIKRLVHASRMLAASTVTQTLHREPFFESDGNGRWRFVRARFLSNTQNNAVWKWQHATDGLIECDDDVLHASLHPLHQSLDKVRERLLPLATTDEDTSTLGKGLAEIISQLNVTPHKHILAQGLRDLLHRHVANPEVDLRTDPMLHSTMQNASPAVWENVLRAALENEIQMLRDTHSYERAIALLHHWTDINEQGVRLLHEVEAEGGAWNLVNAPAATLEDILQAIKRVPKLTVARKRLYQMVQAQLCAFSTDHWLAQEHMRIVPLFFEHIVRLHQAHALLTYAQQEVIEQIIRDEASKLWDAISDGHKIDLLIQLHTYAPSAPLSHLHLQYLLHSIQKYRARPIIALLLGETAWHLCSPQSTVERNTIAAHLADLYNQLEIWELSQDRQWIKALDRRKVDDLKSGINMFKHTRYIRLQKFTQKLDEIKVTSLIQALQMQRDDLRQRATAYL